VKKLFFLLPIIIVTSCYKEDELLEISGKVKEATYYHEVTKTLSRRTYHYTSFGEVAREQRFYPDGEDAGEITYYCNDKNQLVEVVSTVHGYRYEEQHTYDKDGRLINTVGSGKATSCDYIYDIFDNLSEKRAYHFVEQEKKYLTTQMFHYDDEDLNRVIEESLWRTGNGELASAKLEEKLEYIYDTNNNLIQKKLVDGRDHFYRGTKEFYNYDNQGRLYKKVVYNLDVTIPYGVEGTFTYYYYE
jgi:hypothetical protein